MIPIIEVQCTTNMRHTLMNGTTKFTNLILSILKIQSLSIWIDLNWVSTLTTITHSSKQSNTKS